MTSFDPTATTGFPGAGKADAPALTEALAPELGDLQERLFANGRVAEAGAKKILIVLQGMDTSGKGGVIRHAIGMVDPQGVHIKAFKAPTEEERAHPYLWRIERELPEPGLIGIFDRSHYEDVLIVRVNNLVEESVWSKRYDEINAWEEGLVADGTVLIKCFLNISSAEQKARLAGAARRSDQVLEVQPGRRRRTGQVAALPAGLPSRPGTLQHPARAVVRHSVRPQVVSQLGGGPAPRRAPAVAQPALAARRLRRRSGEVAGGQYLRQYGRIRR